MFHNFRDNFKYIKIFFSIIDCKAFEKIFFFYTLPHKFSAFPENNSKILDKIKIHFEHFYICVNNFPILTDKIMYSDEKSLLFYF